MWIEAALAFPLVWFLGGLPIWAFRPAQPDPTWYLGPYYWLGRSIAHSLTWRPPR